MIVLDERERDLLPYFKPFDCRIESITLECGDASWVGEGPDGNAVTVGVERKKIRDLVQSMRSRRLNGFQAPLMCETYDVRYLVVEGVWRPTKEGSIEELRGKDWRVLAPGAKPILFREVDSFLSSMEEFFGFRVKQTQRESETAAWIVSRYKYWSKPYDQHHTHEQIYAPAPENGVGRKPRFVSLESDIRRTCGPNAVYTWKMAAQLPGLDRKAELIARTFHEPEEMFLANRKDWLRALQIKGKSSKVVDEVMRILHG